MQPEHEAELNAFPRTPRMKLIYALGMLSDVVDGDMTGEERDIHINDAKEIILMAWNEE
jgi:hypothetical protein